ncbi:hypothetical protein PT274_01965 [Leuconostocaceae bacterium ESL0958]|nr:hypothetical protein [Leuconostocaceae bacterium ESL0958]
MESAQILIDHNCINEKEQRQLAALQSALAGQPAVAEVETSSKEQPVQRIAKRWVHADQQQGQPTLVIGNQATLNAVLNVYCQGELDRPKPLAFVEWPAKHASGQAVAAAVGQVLNQGQLQAQVIGKIAGLIPKEGQAYFVQQMQVGSDWSALFNRQSQEKKAGPGILRQSMHYLSQKSTQLVPLTFSWTYQTATNYQQEAATISWQLTLAADQATLYFLPKMPWPKLVLAYRQGQKEPSATSRRGLTKKAIPSGTTFAIHDLQSVRLDGRPIQSGAYHFTFETVNYPFITLPQNKKQLSNE